MARLPAFLTRNTFDPDCPAPPEVPWLRAMGIVVLIAFIVVGCVTEPQPGLDARGLAIAGLMIVFALGWITSAPMHQVPPGRRLVRLCVAATAGVVLVGLQPDGLWVVTPYVVASIAAMRLPRGVGTGIFVADLVATVAVASASGQGDQAISVAIGTVPWFLFMRLMRRQREEHEVTKGLVRELEVSRAHEAEAAADA